MHAISSRTTRFHARVHARAASQQHGSRLVGLSLADMLAGLAFVAAIVFASAIIFGFVG